MKILILLTILAFSVEAAQGEDWTALDGKTYQQVKVVKVEDDAVTILDADGGALVPLEHLTPELQQRFHYDREKAKRASIRREAQSQATTLAVEQARKLETKASLAVPAKTELVASAPAGPTSAQPGSSQFSLNRGDAGSSKTSHETVDPHWKLVWSDEFDGSAVDPAKWNFEIDGHGGGNGEMEYYTDKPENAHIESGHLLITAIKDGSDADGQRHAFTSARMTTKHKFSWKYGRFEARIKLPKGRGVWPAFWLMPEDEKYGGWASSGEIDIAEEVGDQSNTLYGTLHYGDKWPGNVHTGDKFVLPSGDLGDDFHVYALEWEEGVMRWYIDGKLYQTQTKWYTHAAPFPAPFDQKFFMILNFAVGGAWPGPPSADTPFPQTMDIDYVRVYQPDQS